METVSVPELLIASRGERDDGHSEGHGEGLEALGGLAPVGRVDDSIQRVVEVVAQRLAD